MKLNQEYLRRALARALQPDGQLIVFDYDYEGEARRVVVVAWGEYVRGWDLNRQDWRTFKWGKMANIEWPG